MNKRDLSLEVFNQLESSKFSLKDIETIISLMTDIVQITVKKGDDVTLQGFGTFTKTKKSSRNGTNPNTGEKIRIRSKVVPKFIPGKGFRELLLSK